MVRELYSGRAAASPMARRPSAGRRLRRAAVVGALASCLLAPGLAHAGHTIKPGRYPAQLDPKGTIHWGIPGPERLRSDAYTGPCSEGKVYRGTRNLARYVRYWWGKRETQYYACRAPSLHGEGRAFDYFLDKNRPKQKRKGDKIFWFFRKKDSGGTKFAPMRRFGVQTVIWNCRIYSASNREVRTYFRCDPNDDGYTTSPTLRHEDHVHIDLNWKGAKRKRSAWTGYRPCFEGHPGCPL